MAFFIYLSVFFFGLVIASLQLLVMINGSRPGKRLSYALPLKQNKVRAKYGGGGQKKLGTEMRNGRRDQTKERVIKLDGKVRILGGEGREKGPRRRQTRMEGLGKAKWSRLG